MLAAEALLAWTLQLPDESPACPALCAVGNLKVQAAAAKTAWAGEGGAGYQQAGCGGGAGRQGWGL